MDILFILTGAVVLGIGPNLLFALLLWWFDRYEREPWPLLAVAFLWGFLPAAAAAVVIGLLFDAPLTLLFEAESLPYTLLSTSVTGPLVEEAIKGLGVLIAFLLFREEIDSIYDGVLYGGMIGFGFASIENVLYLSSTESLGDLIALAFFRSFLFGLNHAMFTAMTGIGFALARFGRSPVAKVLPPLLGLSAATLLHALHNFGVTLASINPVTLLLSLLSDWAGVLFVLSVILASLARQGRWVRAYLREEVELGTLSATQLTVLSSLSSRLRIRWRLLSRGKLSEWRRMGRFLHLTSKLAFKKHQLSSMGDERGNAERVDALREEVASLSQGLAQL